MDQLEKIFSKSWEYGELDENGARLMNHITYQGDKRVVESHDMNSFFLLQEYYVNQYEDFQWCPVTCTWSKRMI